LGAGQTVAEMCGQERRRLQGVPVAGRIRHYVYGPDAGCFETRSPRKPVLANRRIYVCQPGTKLTVFITSRLIFDPVSPPRSIRYRPSVT
jgi:hypothetical protein